ncbi:MAG: glycoside hydrolase family 92 protein, partial [Muribaculaceae bacterium]|nr:glycoside hydrolase family 92 protein [Muribaculaceae bacterium]
YLKYGYIPVEDSVPDAFHKREQVSRTLEYAFDDFALAQVAEKLGKTSDYDILMSRAENWRNVIDPKTGYATPRKADGSFIPTDPFTFSKHITEGVPCHYTWYVPHDQEGLIAVLGGEKKYAEKLDSMFTQRRHWHGNEPCHQIPWLFSYVGRPEKTAKYVRHIMETEYLDSPGGLSGNDDAGQMSAWYIFAALGFYPVCPASPYYVLGTPLFEHIEINLENGNKFVIEAPGATHDNYEVESITLNGKPLDGFLLSHSDLMNGGTLRFNLK